MRDPNRLVQLFALLAALVISALAIGQRAGQETKKPFAAQGTAQLSGKVTDSEAKPAGFVEVTLMADDPNFIKDSTTTYFDLTREDGTYVIKAIPPGRYLLGINITEPPSTKLPYPRMYYPAAPVRFQAKPIEIAEGQQLTSFDFRLPPRLKEHLIPVIVTFANGQPAIGAYAHLQNPEYPGEEVEGNVKHTDTEGRVTLTGLQGLRYLVRAELKLENKKEACAGPVDVLAAGELAPVKLVLSRSAESCAEEYAEGSRPAKWRKFWPFPRH
jgi:hypothetical protein